MTNCFTYNVHQYGRWQKEIRRQMFMWRIYDLNLCLVLVNMSDVRGKIWAKWWLCGCLAMRISGQHTTYALQKNNNLLCSYSILQWNRSICQDLKNACVSKRSKDNILYSCLIHCFWPGYIWVQTRCSINIYI